MSTDTTETGKDVAVIDETKGTAVAVYDLDADDIGAGFENVTTADYKPSFIRVLQPLSPQVLNEMVGAKAGKLADSVTNEFYDSLNYVPSVREHVYVAWKPRNEGGGDGQGFGGVYSLNDEVVVNALKGFDKWARDEQGKLKLPRTADGEFQLIETVYYHGVMSLANGGIFPATLPFSSTGLPVAQMWLNLQGRQIITEGPYAGRQRPMYQFEYKVSSVKETKGSNTWFTPVVTWARENDEASRLATNSALFIAAKKVAKAFKDGNAKVDYAQGGNASDQASASSKKDAEIPF
jgi:hypothetical protein